MNWSDKRVITGWALVAFVIVVLIVTIGVTVHAAGVRNDDRMRQCLATDRAAVDCRLGIYGSV